VATSKKLRATTQSLGSMFADYTYTLSVVIDYARVAVDYMRKCLLSGNVMELEGPTANLRLTTAHFHGVEDLWT